VERRTQLAFVLLIVAQAAHSVEEFVARLYDVFPPARFVSHLFSNDARTGFVIANVLLVACAVWCWLVPVRRGWATSQVVAVFWAVLELTNGTIHTGLAVLRGSYFPGVLTAPLLLVTGAWLWKRSAAEARD
jgi:hypothetical protein